jgi:hypothetical protein
MKRAVFGRTTEQGGGSECSEICAKFLERSSKKGGKFRVFRDLCKLYREGEEEGGFCQRPRKGGGQFRVFKDLRKLFREGEEEGGFRQRPRKEGGGSGCSEICANYFERARKRAGFGRDHGTGGLVQAVQRFAQSFSTWQKKKRGAF